MSQVHTGHMSARTPPKDLTFVHTVRKHSIARGILFDIYACILAKNVDAAMSVASRLEIRVASGYMNEFTQVRSLSHAKIATRRSELALTAENTGSFTAE